MSGSTLPLPGFGLPDEAKAAGFGLPFGPENAPPGPQAAPRRARPASRGKDAPPPPEPPQAAPIWICRACETEYAAEAEPRCPQCGSSAAIAEAEYEPPDIEPKPLGPAERLREAEAELAYQANFYRMARREAAERLASLKVLGRRVGELRRQARKPRRKPA